MKFSVAAVAAFAGAASAGFVNVTTVTIPCEITSTSVVKSYVTYCPEATTIIEGNKTIIVTEPGTVTITDCPCTRTSTKKTVTVTTCPVSNGTPVLPSTIVPIPTHPVESKPVESKPVETKPVETKPAETKPITTKQTPPVSNVTVPPVSQGGAAAVGVSGAFAGVVAVAAYFL
ncbi:hypothetical protein DV113_000173 [Geotrichum candidum]|uniref:Similar to Saccharomyces cerevisiae YDR077W SED1 Major stress-induced structural GPI-cell wall glycoprotein in stationary-phase cell n=1 Tax=Geotrichum candidum TaxID=1173061 RepID=A0A0J9X8E9_GEOCN|nr:hypothetical protein DV454_001074 [Geotrichum candidum]KAF5118543.1 hypothetical protein DV452_002004 [Geotrichum candidum]KAF7501840.1 hypothetical protein DV113_000173 [Geotrichum candidum]KAI8132951.1 hypothetical protein DUD61_003398 [Geotrichum candidum]CDO53428.1 similar to Saccharomyces cerevisiae YDR077W SED1 Major stress-induced structural GPI-cell wall glycoprotein in stationary-phase cell [Geotrichum candidum]